MNNQEFLEKDFDLKYLNIAQSNILVRRTLDLIKLHRNSQVFILLAYSASPFEILIRNLWKKAYPYIQIPQFIHLNIGHKTSIAMRLNDKSSITDIVDYQSRYYLEDELKDVKNVTFVDDVSYTGETEELVRNLINFIDSKINSSYFPFIHGSLSGSPSTEEIAFWNDDEDFSSRIFMPWKKKTQFGSTNYVNWSPMEDRKYILSHQPDSTDTEKYGVASEIEVELEKISNLLDTNLVKKYLSS